jgi:hypothetical protein
MNARLGEIVKEINHPYTRRLRDQALMTLLTQKNKILLSHVLTQIAQQNAPGVATFTTLSAHSTSQS